MTPQSRPATREDETFLFELYSSTRDDLLLLPDPMGKQLVEVQYKARRAQYESTYPSAWHSILLVDGELVGALIVNEAQEMRIVDIALLPEFRNRGYGTAFIKELCELGKPVTLSVRADNPASNLYRRLGFEEVGRDEMYVEMKKGL